MNGMRRSRVDIAVVTACQNLVIGRSSARCAINDLRAYRSPYERIPIELIRLLPKSGFQTAVEIDTLACTLPGPTTTGMSAQSGHDGLSMAQPLLFRE